MKENKVTYWEIKVTKNKDKTSFSIDINIEWSKDFILSNNLALFKVVNDLEKNYKNELKKYFLISLIFKSKKNEEKSAILWLFKKIQVYK